MKLAISFLIFIGFYSFSSLNDFGKNYKSKKQVKRKVEIIKLCNGYNSLELIKQNNTIIGKHCFIFNDGKRVDCCEDDKKTISLKKGKNNIWFGNLKSCYDNDNFKIKLIKLSNNNYIFYIKNYDLTHKINFVRCK